MHIAVTRGVEYDGTEPFAQQGAEAHFAVEASYGAEPFCTTGN